MYFSWQALFFALILLSSVVMPRILAQSYIPQEELTAKDFQDMQLQIVTRLDSTIQNTPNNAFANTSIANATKNNLHHILLLEHNNIADILVNNKLSLYPYAVSTLVDIKSKLPDLIINTKAESEVMTYLDNVISNFANDVNLKEDSIIGSQNYTIIIPPLKQFKIGYIIKDVKCEQDLQLIIKTSGNFPVCVKPETAKKLVERGWGVLKEQTTWFKYNPTECQNTPWVKELVNSNNTNWYNENWYNGTMIKKYFHNHGITLLKVRNYGYLTLRPSMCGAIADWATFYFLLPVNDTSKMIELGFKEVDEKEVQGSEILLPNITNAEQKIWFEFVPIQCQIVPWLKPIANTTMAYSESVLIKGYFKEQQGITILDMKGAFKITENLVPCGYPSGNTYYFLVSESDSYKMTKLGYEKLTTSFLANAQPIR